VIAQRVERSPSRDEGHILSGARHQTAIEPAESARSHHRDPHRISLLSQST
jgi:hypothetical protein